jgi:hypothetical protein
VSAGSADSEIAGSADTIPAARYGIEDG